MLLKKFWEYINVFQKRKTDEKANFNLKVMHGINRISILMFLAAMIILAIRYLT